MFIFFGAEEVHPSTFFLTEQKICCFDPYFVCFTLLYFSILKYLQTWYFCRCIRAYFLFQITMNVYYFWTGGSTPFFSCGSKMCSFGSYFLWFTILSFSILKCVQTCYFCKYIRAYFLFHHECILFLERRKYTLLSSCGTKDV